MRIHHDAQAHQLTQAVGALAFTAGSDIFFRTGTYQPDTLVGLSLLTHEVTHVVQQARLDMIGIDEICIGDAEDAFEQEAKANERQMLAHYTSLHTAVRREEGVQCPLLTASMSGGTMIQCAVGLEIEIPVPIDKLTAAEVVQVQGFVAAAQAATAAGNNPMADKMAARGAMEHNGRVPYGILQAAANGFRVDADHDDRVKTADPNNTGWPPREGGYDSIIEIVTEPPTATAAAFNAAMNNVQAFVNQINVQTNNLTTRWLNAFPAVPFAPNGVAPFVANVNVGPMDFTAQGFPLVVHMPHHNFQGSIQVNIDIDLREYHSLIKWYADSNYAVAAQAPVAEQPMYRQIKDDIRDAVNTARAITQNIANGVAPFPPQTPAQRATAGNFRGMRGWLTHIALYLKRGMIGPGVLAGNIKNLVPILIKSPNAVLATYGMTAYELNVYTNNRHAILDQILQQLGRPALIAGQPLNAVDVFASQPGVLDLDQLSDPARVAVPLAGTAIPNPPNLGLWRTGNAAVQAIAVVPGTVNTRGGLVAEFRSFPRFYDGVASWRALGLDFLQQANARNARNGIAPH